MGMFTFLVVIKENHIFVWKGKTKVALPAYLFEWKDERTTSLLPVIWLFPAGDSMC